ncbi:aminoacylase [Tropicimonas sp. TH_r6]|uniref:aminoacylase n=1 Tax=Tropicimonas sp. TH_r6 TaxID=3082085 RepID=UPI002953B094|nr:aminoacylase [Tropicimonas sp. TH_r6]MDV7145656.1 aminoacylase [Tropicimonas sp. TH_r6]
MKKTLVALLGASCLSGGLAVAQQSIVDDNAATFGWYDNRDWTNVELADPGDRSSGFVPVDWKVYRSGDKPYDVVITGGRVIDPASGLDAVRNLGIVGNRIVTVSEEALNGTEVIEAEGLVVAPGFIDTHAHGMDPFTNKMMLRDGVTSAGDLEYGSLQIAKFYEDREGISLINYFTGVSHEYARIAAMDGVIATENTFVYPVRAKAGADGESAWAERFPTDDEFAEMKEWIRQGMKDGALSFATTIGYFPAFAHTWELYELQKIAAEYGRISSGHFRMLPHDPPPLEYIMGYKEAMANAVGLGIPLLLSHNNNRGWEEMHEIVVGARENGMVIWDEQYPWAAGGPNAGAPPLTPENFEYWGQKIEEVLFDPAQDKFLTEEEFMKMREEAPETNLLWFARPQEWVPQFCATPDMVIANDVLPMLQDDGTFLPLDFPYEEWAGHPRGAGSRGLCFRLNRENNVPLMLTINNASTFSARMLCKAGVQQMCVRGRVQEGMIADLVVLDPETIRENADYGPGKNGLPTTGIPHVLVSGQVAVRDSVVDLDVRAGVAIRHTPVAD